MSDVARLLRYLVPGALFEMVIGVWLFVDRGVYSDPQRLSDLGVAVPVFAMAAAFPLGFVAANIASEVGWLARKFRWSSWIVKRRDDDAILAAVSSELTEGTAEFVRSVRPGIPSSVANVVLVDLLLHSVAQADAARLSALTDRFNALLNARGAVVLGLLTIVAWFVIGDFGEFDAAGLIAWVIASVVGIVIVAVLWSAELRIEQQLTLYAAAVARRDHRKDE